MLFRKLNTVEVSLFILILFFKMYPQTVNSSNGVDYEFGNIGLKQGLSQSTVYAIVQDAQGFMWFGTQDGLNRYDGYSIKVFKHNPADSNSIADDRINCLLSDSKGNLWIGTANGGVDRYVLPEGKFYHHFNNVNDSLSLSNNNVTALFEDSVGNLWVGTNYGLNLYNRKNNTFKHYFFDVKNRSSLNGNSITAICEDQDFYLWVGTYNGLFKLNLKGDLKFTRIKNLNANPHTAYGNNVTSLYVDNKGSIWIGTYDASLKRYNKKSKTFYYYKNTAKAINSIYEGSKGNLWLGSDYISLRILNLKSETVSQISSIDNDLINTLYQDKNGILWIGSVFRGAFIYDRNKNRFRHYLNNPQNPNMVMSIIEDRNGELWAATYGNGLKNINKKRDKITTYRFNPNNPNSLSSDKTFSLCETTDGNIWVGTIGGGLDCFNKSTNTFKHYMQHSPIDKKGLSNNDITSLYEDTNDNLWIGNVTGGIDILNLENKTFRHYYSGEKNPNTLGGVRSVTKFYTDKKGTMWIGTLAGFKLFDPKLNSFVDYKLNPYSKKQNSLSISITDFLFEGNIIWIGTSRDGFLKYNTGTDSLISYTTNDGLPDNVVYGILPDRSGHLWISTNKGISKFNPALGTFKNYDVNDGLQANEFNQGSYFQAPDGEMFFGGVNGFNAFYPNKIKENKIVPPVYLTAFKIFDKPLKLNRPISYVKKIKLSYSQNFFSFEFVVLDYTSPEKNKYAYMLEGFDKDWHMVPAKQRYASYTNLDPGEYVLHIKGSNNDGIWNNKGISLSIIITPPFWMTWWFKILVIAAIITLAAAAYNYRVNKLRELDRMRLRIASDLHDEVGSDLGGISLIGQRLQKQRDIPKTIDKGLLEINDAAFKTAEKLRDIVWFVNPEHDKSEHLVNRLKDLTSVLLKDMDYKFSINEGVTFENVDLEFRRQLYLIFKEILHNITKHADAKKVYISFEQNHQEFRIIVKDDGKGFSKAYEGVLAAVSFEKLQNISNGMGLKNIYRRAEDINAKVFIQSKPGKGTTVTFSAKIP